MDDGVDIFVAFENLTVDESLGVAFGTIRIHRAGIADIVFF